MKYLSVGGEKKEIPRFPHHKNHINRYYRFFQAKSLFGLLTIDGYGQVIRKLYMNWRTRSAVPRLLLIDPTTSCNLHCTGCWARDYEKNVNLSFDKLDELCTDAQKIGVLQIIFSGGEPLMRKKDILKLAERHRKLTFGMFTNGTLIDEAFAESMARLGNLNAFISIEGFRDETDMRRGDGVFDMAIRAMDLLKKHDIGFGFSTCYHAGNYETIAGDEFLGLMREKGAWLGWLFNYMPIGSDADMSLCCSAKQRAYMKQKLEDYQKKHGFLVIDFANSGHKAIGCVAAGNDFAHINANGDMEPCAFCHYSDVNVNDVSLVEALRSPFFKKFRQRKPFSKNFLRPCPMIDVPEAIVGLTKNGGVRSTHLAFPETAEQLAAKTSIHAGSWEPVANDLWRDMPEGEKRRFGRLTKIMHWGNKLKTRSFDHPNTG